jgi:transcriptional regulator with XRE-family HTH domain
VDPERLRHELAIRGLDAIDLARTAHLSPATVSAALAGRPISASSLRLMAAALQATPVDEFIDRLLGPVAKTEG